MTPRKKTTRAIKKPDRLSLAANQTRNAYKLGATAWHQNQFRNTNPYPIGYLRRAWHIGWDYENLVTRNIDNNKS